jgi:hypothetical protein
MDFPIFCVIEYDTLGYRGPGRLRSQPFEGAEGAAHLADHSLYAHPIAQDAARCVRRSQDG